jgi:uncharacterized protein YcaQ
MVAINLKTRTDLARLRKVALHSQGLLRDATFGRGKGAALRAIEHVGYVQIDTISVVERAHHHVWRSRVPNFTGAMAEKLLEERRIFEYWAHAASFLPMRDYRFYLRMQHRYRNGEERWIRSRDTKLMSEVLARIKSDGPLRSRDLDDPRPERKGWWDWKPAKRAVEQLYMQGDLMVANRDGFQKTYDLTERVLPQGTDTRMPTEAEQAAHLLEQELRCHGFVSLKGVTYGRRRDPKLRQAVKGLVQTELAAGSLDVIRIPNGQTFYARPGLLDHAAPRSSRSVRILSPFDNAVIQRERLDALFAFDYQIECYVPAPRRKFGYFCLPVLYRDEFIGRMDCKAHRQERLLEIRQLHFEDGAMSNPERVDAFAAALPSFLEFQGCDRLKLSHAEPTAIRRPLEQAIAAHIGV